MSADLGIIALYDVICKPPSILFEVFAAVLFIGGELRQLFWRGAPVFRAVNFSPERFRVCCGHELSSVSGQGFSRWYPFPVVMLYSCLVWRTRQ